MLHHFQLGISDILFHQQCEIQREREFVESQTLNSTHWPIGPTDLVEIVQTSNEMENTNTTHNKNIPTSDNAFSEKSFESSTVEQSKGKL